MGNMPNCILIITGGILQIPAIIEAKNLGLKSIVTDKDKNAPCMDLADQSYAIDIFDIEGHLKLLKKIQKKNKIVGIFTEGSEATVTVAALAKQLKLPGISISGAQNCKNKFKTRKILQKNNIPIPKWEVVKNLNEFYEAVKKIKFPLIVKAADNSASRGTTKKFGNDNLKSSFELAKNNSSNGLVLVEELCFGSEQSVEILFDRKKCYDLNIVDRYFSKNKWAVELGHVNPTNLDINDKEKLFQITRKAAKAMKIKFGVFKADIMITEKGPIIIEVTPRLSGGFDSQKSTPISSGRNFIRAAMRLSVGLNLEQKDLTHQWTKYCAVWAINAKKGNIKKISGISKVNKMEGVKEIILIKNKGDFLVTIKDSGSRPGYVVAEGQTYHIALRRAKKGAKMIKFEVEN
jgi:biotin carboxylase